MTPAFAVVDGSNIATEGRSTPRLAQLDEAVREFEQQFPGLQVIVVVDATFGHRIDPSEHEAFDEALAHGEIVSPPAGAIGRGDAFLLRVAERVGAQVLSNDSFQEFHGKHPWLFDEGRLTGATYVPGVGWMFTPRNPVRGPRSRAARAAEARRVEELAGSPRAVVAAHEPAKEVWPKKSKKQVPRTHASRKVAPAKTTKPVPAKTTKPVPAKTTKPVPVKATTTVPVKATKTVPVKTAKTAKRAKTAKTAKTARSAGPAKKGVAKTAGEGSRPQRKPPDDVRSAIEVATEEALVPGDDAVPGRLGVERAPRRSTAPRAVNDPLTFLTFVSEHPIGSVVEGVVSSFTSHGAMVDVDGMHCYVPSKGLGDPPPRRAKEVLSRGEMGTFAVVALDPSRRGAELVLREISRGAD